ncbi:chitinase acidic [Rhinolophus ferrumequinum]|uniref:chitinase n=1 Tax=Rhinolophus ferrumequinum TaxID=59479 RepID=A0A7J7SW82_RHIFE|nr:chitinase acidic [Rhinolophus ferrumequinum]
MAKFILLTRLTFLLNAQLGSAYPLICYFTNCAQYRPSLGRFKPDDIDPCLCTHLIYAFAGMRNNEITTIKWNDLTTNKLSMARKTRGQADQQPRLMVTAAVAAGISNIHAGYEIPQLSQYLDYIHVMTYDLHGSWEGYTGENSLLYKYPTDTGSNAYLNVICTFLKSGATEVWEASEEAPYAYKGNEWLGYDNTRSFKVKADWLKKNNFGGAMVWAIDLDDFTGTFCNQGKFPLTTTLKNALGLQSASCTAPAQPIAPITPPPSSGRGSGSGSGSGSGTRSGSSSSGGSSGGSGFCSSEANGLYPVANNRNAFWHCLNGITYQQNCPAPLVFDTSCDCCNWR